MKTGVSNSHSIALYKGSLERRDSFSLIPMGDLCSYVSPADGWQCREARWPGSRNGFCLGHDRDPGKPAKGFLQTIQKKFRARDYNFDGFVFPYCLTIKNISTSETVSFLNCYFPLGIRFEHCRFEGPLTTFEHCAFGGSLVYFRECQFVSARNTFAQSTLQGGMLAFHRCRFEGEETDFDGVKWQADRRITFVHCTFNSTTTSFHSSHLRAPLIAFRGGALGSESVLFRNANFFADTLEWSDIYQTRGVLSHIRSLLQCNQVEFGPGNWMGQGVHFRNSRWQGERFGFGEGNQVAGLEIDRCHFEGKEIDFSDLLCRGSLRIEQTRFLAADAIDFSRSQWNPQAVVQNCCFQSKRLLCQNLCAEGDEWLFQRNRIDSEQIRFEGSRFQVKRASWSRSIFRAETVDFSGCLFQNLQTSFQATEWQGQTGTFLRSQFDSNRVSFQRAGFDLNQLVMDSVNWGSGLVSFWRCILNRTRLTFHDAEDRGATIRFGCDLSNALLDGARFSEGILTGVTWDWTGWHKRPRLANESALLAAGHYAELQRLYRWIADQYEKTKDYRMQHVFLQAEREIEDLERIQHGKLDPRLRWEFSRLQKKRGSFGFSPSALMKRVAGFFVFLSFFIFRFR